MSVAVEINNLLTGVGRLNKIPQKTPDYNPYSEGEKGENGASEIVDYPTK